MMIVLMMIDDIGITKPEIYSPPLCAVSCLQRAGSRDSLAHCILHIHVQYVM